MFDQKQYDQDYYQKNRESILVKKRLYRTTEQHRKNSIDRYNQDPEKFKAYQKQLRKNDPKQHMVYRTRASAKRRNLEHLISVDDFNIPDMCPLLGIPLIVAEGLPSNNSPSLDRIDSSKGYIPGNVWVISHRANMIKTNATFEELKLLVQNLENRV